MANSETAKEIPDSYPRHCIVGMQLIDMPTFFSPNDPVHFLAHSPGSKYGHKVYCTISLSPNEAREKNYPIEYGYSIVTIQPDNANSRPEEGLFLYVPHENAEVPAIAEPFDVYHGSFIEELHRNILAATRTPSIPNSANYTPVDHAEQSITLH